jgi:hypothetical protein
MTDAQDIKIPEQTTTGREAEAEYTLEYSVLCPHCAKEPDSLKVVRLLRTRVNSTSTLPRRGRVLACPECHRYRLGRAGRVRLKLPRRGCTPALPGDAVRPRTTPPANSWAPV